ncbi:hypothetical protein [uncultured Bradyrhizobium sp.]|jgi:hypothetical protein|uniref:hypothetical protein n=1 Tax=uncultured Bradyrhizobium sp. TaxID=199684 RepID=UPI00262D3515|nr:hypothetical protein [uncultured Bradyrhizobium sp.]
MRKFMLNTVTTALIAASASHAFAAQPQHHVRKVTRATSEQWPGTRNAVAQPAQPAWPYSGWSAPAGR